MSPGLITGSSLILAGRDLSESELGMSSEQLLTASMCHYWLIIMIEVRALHEDNSIHIYLSLCTRTFVQILE